MHYRGFPHRKHTNFLIKTSFFTAFRKGYKLVHVAHIAVHSRHLSRVEAGAVFACHILYAALYFAQFIRNFFAYEKGFVLSSFISFDPGILYKRCRNQRLRGYHYRHLRWRADDLLCLWQCLCRDRPEGTGRPQGLCILISLFLLHLPLQGQASRLRRVALR